MSTQTLFPETSAPASEQPLTRPIAAAGEPEARPLSQGMSPAFADTDVPREINEFDYKPVPVIAPVSLFLGLAAVSGLFTLVGILVGLAGAILGGFALRAIRRSSGELGGRWIAATGFLLSAILTVGSATLHAATYATEVPEGFRRINFTHDIAKKGFKNEDGKMTIHPDVRLLNDQRIFLKGYMYPERQNTNLTQFVLVKDNLQCCFGGQPQLTDMILIEMDPGQMVDYTTELVSVAGVFKAREPQQAGSLMTVYKLDASYFSKAKTSF